MQNSLLSYFSKRLSHENAGELQKGDPGPVITISRQVGCNGVKLAKKIAEKLNENYTYSNWKVLSKEVFEQTAKELDMETEKIRRMFKQDDSYAFNEILNAIGTNRFKSEKKIAKTVREVIHTFAVDGHCIIVGRGAHIIARDIKNALHIRLIAPIEYRIKTIMKNNHLNREEAIHFINKVEKERISFRNAIGKISMEDDLFDLFINRASFNDDDTIYIIKKAGSRKGIFNHYSNTQTFY